MTTSASAPETEAPWTVRRLLGWTTERFEAVGIESPRVDAEHLLAFALRCSRMSLYLEHDKLVEASERAVFRELVKRRLAREPVAYIEGKRGFHALGLELHVDRRVLIPRPETELLVDWVLEELAGPRPRPPWPEETEVLVEDQDEDEPALESAPAPAVEPEPAPEPPPPDERAVLDVGTGSGAIALAIKHARSTLRVMACDVSEDALAVAHDNAQRLGLDVPMVRSDLLSGIPRPEGGWAVIVANLPYICAPVLRALAPEVQRFEPMLALDGGTDGLDVIRRLVAEAPEQLAPGGALYLEIGYDQGDSVPALLCARGLVDVAVRKDYAGHPRIVRGRRAG
ncbi:peptide chain release factor N(5)-glutamine methyltransferase [Paraliomyxa miuraensis]|uniref:peptide chain release factor N(5)-glutamine methyltransferase n=1 Tax=Paraliomyxa miuraensis TaxID=376150 RepID=UPI00224E24FC|nr:peptide chain release factor N(5)-glutamine methyltransferase [Paraliomyxa miuraensis]MCX4246990.1 peptide chain release factor N(5)-glutamine methyltransferase [Paraliomyxa miuraensis]